MFVMHVSYAVRAAFWAALEAAEWWSTGNRAGQVSRKSLFGAHRTFGGNRLKRSKAKAIC